MSKKKSSIWFWIEMFSPHMGALAAALAKRGFEVFYVANYGVFKAFEEIQIKQLSDKFNIDTIIARIFNITGPGEPERMVGGAFVSQLIEGNILEVGNLFPRRDFLDIRDAADA